MLLQNVKVGEGGMEENYISKMGKSGGERNRRKLYVKNGKLTIEVKGILKLFGQF